ncbi:MAG: DUF3098 domain-containing protein [Muribaculaceae bacterium]|nr:DUF3098 domain-containing protein [Muribaculaceae bacterium]
MGNQKYTPIFSRTNIIMMACCLVLIILGFILMSGAPSTIDRFNPDIFSVRRIVVGPTLSFLGFLLMAFAIIYTPRKRGADTRDDMNGIKENEPAVNIGIKEEVKTDK